MSSRYKPPFNPWEPPELADQELYALRALVAGKASDGQQKIALSVIITKFCATYDMSFRPGGNEADRATAFAEGKRFVGQRILEAISRPLKPAPQTGDKNDRTRSTTSGDPTTSGSAATRRNPKPKSAAKG